MNKLGRSVAQQAGFTLIELIMVVVILGVLSAFALPRFANFRGNATAAAATAARSAVNSASDIVHSASIIAGNSNALAAANGVTLEGNRQVNLVYGYPAADDLADAVDLSGFNIGLAANGVVTISSATNTNCTFTYTQATAVVGPPLVITPPVFGPIAAACNT